MENQLQNLTLTERETFGFVPLAAKLDANKNGTPVLVDTNIHKINISPNIPIYKYNVEIIYVFVNKDNICVNVDVSKCKKKGTAHESSKSRCAKIYAMAVQRFNVLKERGPFFYDRQSNLYSLSKLPEKKLTFEVEGVSTDPAFVKALFTVSETAESFQASTNDIANTVNSCPARADKTMLEALNVIVSAPAYENKNVITVGNCVHYLYDSSSVDIECKQFDEGGLYSGIGASKSVKTLQSPDKVPSLYLVVEMKSTLFHPDYTPLLKIFETFHGFKPDLPSNTPLAMKILQSLQGVDVFLNYGKFKGREDEGFAVQVRGFGLSATETVFEKDGEMISVADYFKKTYNVTLKYPHLFTVEAKVGKKKTFYPPELLLLCPSQKVTNAQMVNSEQTEMIKVSSVNPPQRKNMTEAVAQEVRLINSLHSYSGLFQIGGPVKMQGLILKKPKIVFGSGHVAVLPNTNSRVPTDFSIDRAQFYGPKELKNWELVFHERESIDKLDEILVGEMQKRGMKVAMPAISYIAHENIEPIFKKAKSAGRQLLFFVSKERRKCHEQIKAFEQKYDILTQEIKYETAEKMYRQPQTKLNIVNKTNIKLGGLNYLIQSDGFKNQGRVVIGLSTSSSIAGNFDAPISIGFSANILPHWEQYSGGFVYAKKQADVFGSSIKQVVLMVLAAVRSHCMKGTRVKPTEVYVYFNGVAEGQYAMINEKYVAKIKEAFEETAPGYKPDLVVVASSKAHNERLYKSDNNRIFNLEPGTVVDHTIVSPVLNEFYMASAVARKGTVKAPKYTLIYNGSASLTMSSLEHFTNDLCYAHQIVFHPVSLPVPLYLASDFSERGSRLLNQSGAVYKDGEVDLEATNKQLGYGNKKLFETRFNA